MTHTFKVMLAASEVPTASDLLYPIMVSYKYDGIRTALTGGVAMSRKMIPLPNTCIQEWAREHGDLLEGIDGEMIFGPPNTSTTFNKSTSGCNKASGGDGFTFYVFEKWDSKLLAEDRYHELLVWYHHLPPEVSSRVVIVEQRVLHTLKDLQSVYAEALALGYEGLIIKEPLLRYKNGRSTVDEGYCLKWKEFIFHEARILSVNQGQKNTNEKKKDEIGFAKRSSAKAGQVLVDQVGNFRVTDIDPKSPHYGKEFSCGPGCLKDIQLKALWARHSRDNDVVGQLLVYKSQKPLPGNTDLPRFPGFHGWVSLSDTSIPT